MSEGYEVTLSYRGDRLILCYNIVIINNVQSQMQACAMVKYFHHDRMVTERERPFAWFASSSLSRQKLDDSFDPAYCNYLITSIIE